MEMNIFLAYYLVGLLYTCITYMGSSLYKILHKDYQSNSYWWGFILGMIILPIVYPLVIFASAYDVIRQAHKEQDLLNKLSILRDSLIKKHKDAYAHLLNQEDKHDKMGD